MPSRVFAYAYALQYSLSKFVVWPLVDVVEHRFEKHRTPHGGSFIIIPYPCIIDSVNGVHFSNEQAIPFRL